MSAAQDRLAAARAALARGDVIAAYDLATELDGAGEGDAAQKAVALDLAYVEVRALAGMGDWHTGLARYAASGLDRRAEVDFRALKGRLLKDSALGGPTDAARARLIEASTAYAEAWRGPEDFYAAINAASTAMLAGLRDTSLRYARAALEGARLASQDYWSQATQAEALLLLGETAQAEAMLARAAGGGPADVAARASTYRQFATLAQATGQAIDLEPVRPPRAAHFCGHIFLASPAHEARIAAAVRQELSREGIGWAFGSLAAGADLVIAEACLDAGIELHVVLPFDEDDFLTASVDRGGAGWRARYRRCLERATRVHRASTMRFVGDDHQYAFGSKVAMGLARLQARQVGSEAVQLAVWDGVVAPGPAGTAPDIATWQQDGGRTLIIDGGALPRPVRQSASGAARAAPAHEADSRALRVMAFTDFKGFSRLREASIPVFWREVMGSAARILSGAGPHLISRNTWGDALYLAFDDVAAAAEALVVLAEALARVDLGALGLPAGGGMRIAAHYGAVYEMTDPVTGSITYCGNEVNRAARVEPVTPPGQVWVTEPLAAAIEMGAHGQFACRYVGRVALAKEYGIEPVYRLERHGCAAMTR